MAMVPTVIGKAVEAKVLAAFVSEFGAIQATNPGVLADWAKQAKIAGVIAETIIEQILLFGQVAPGSIITAGSPASQTSVTPGKII